MFVLGVGSITGATEPIDSGRAYCGGEISIAAASRRSFRQTKSESLPDRAHLLKCRGDSISALHRWTVQPALNRYLGPGQPRLRRKDRLHGTIGLNHRRDAKIDE